MFIPGQLGFECQFQASKIRPMISGLGRKVPPNEITVRLRGCLAVPLADMRIAIDGLAVIVRIFYDQKSFMAIAQTYLEIHT